MKNLVKVDPYTLEVGSEVYVYGKLRVRYTSEYKNFPGRKGFIHYKGGVVVIRFPGVIGEFMNNHKDKDGGGFVSASFFVKKKVEEKKKEEVKVKKTALDEIREVMSLIRSKDGVEEVVKYLDSSKHPRSILVPRYIAFIGFAYKNGSWGFHSNTACHAGLSYPGKEPSHVISYICTYGKELTEEGRAYFNWLFNYSPWKEAFITKDVDEAYKYGIVGNINVPSNILAGAFIASRCPTEFPNRCKAWYEFVKAGVHPSMAVIWGQYFQCNGTGIYLKIADGHSPFSSRYINKEYVLNFMNNTPIIKSEIYKNNYIYSQVDVTWGSGEGLFKGSFSKAFNKAKDAENRAANPFGAVADSVSLKNIYTLINLLQQIIEA